MIDEPHDTISARLLTAATQIQPLHGRQAFRQLLPLVPLLRAWRAAGYSHAQIGDLLADEGISCSPTSLRGYIARILTADSEFRVRNGRAPNTSELRLAARRAGAKSIAPPNPQIQRVSAPRTLSQRRSYDESDL
jgi:hypothetical protein